MVALKRPYKGWFQGFQVVEPGTLSNQNSDAGVRPPFLPMNGAPEVALPPPGSLPGGTPTCRLSPVSQAQPETLVDLVGYRPWASPC